MEDHSAADHARSASARHRRKSRKAERRTTPSIPTRFETRLKSQSSAPNAFGNRCARFQDAQRDVPGPGKYYRPASYVRSSEECGSVSKKGYGVGFVSKAERFGAGEAELGAAPGPGNYEETAAFERATSRREFSRAPVSSIFVKPKRSRGSALPAPVCNGATPAPGQYDTTKPSLPRYKAKLASSAFLSRSQRGERAARNVPAPGAYNPPSDWDGAARAAGAAAAFRSTSQRVSVTNGGSLQTPGPGAYAAASNQEAQQAAVQRGKIARASVAASARQERYGGARRIPPAHQGPGPGAYDVPPSQPLSSAAAVSSFRSGGKRTFEPGWKPPGPAYYNPALTAHEKRSFLLNVSRKWV